MSMASSPCSQETYSPVGKTNHSLLEPPPPIIHAVLSHIPPCLQLLGRRLGNKMTNSGLLIKDSIESWSPHGESGSVSPEPEPGSTAIVSIVLQPLTAGVCQPSIPPSTPTPPRRLKVSLPFGRHGRSKVERGTGRHSAH